MIQQRCRDQIKVEGEQWFNYEGDALQKDNILLSAAILPYISHFHIQRQVTHASDLTGIFSLVVTGPLIPADKS